MSRLAEEAHRRSVARAQQLVAEAHALGYDLVLRSPNLPVIAAEGEAKRLARKQREEDSQYEWRGDPFLELQDAKQWLPLVRWLCGECGFVQLYDLTAVDPAAAAEDLWLVCGLLDLERKLRLELRLHLPKSDLRVASVAAVYPAADWHEREAAEMFGIVFVGHPDPRSLLLPEDWNGPPLRKDYVFPDEYHGISCT